LRLFRRGAKTGGGNAGSPKLIDIVLLSGTNVIHGWSALEEV
jgi:hypothetical protein